MVKMTMIMTATVMAGGGGDNNNNEGNNDTDGATYSLEGHIKGLTLTSHQHYGVRYVYSHRPQLERSASTSTSFFTYCVDDYDDDFMPHRNSNENDYNHSCAR